MELVNIIFVGFKLYQLKGLNIMRGNDWARHPWPLPGLLCFVNLVFCARLMKSSVFFNHRECYKPNDDI